MHTSITIRPPEEGMVLVGGGISPLDPSVVIGADSYVRSHLLQKAQDIVAFVKTLVSVQSVAAGAFHAERLLFRVLFKTVRQRIFYILRTFAPELTREAGEQVDKAYRSAIQQVLGWSDVEVAQATAQAELPIDEAGHDFAPVTPLATIAHLASWLDATEAGCGITKQELCENA